MVLGRSEGLPALLVGSGGNLLRCFVAFIRELSWKWVLVLGTFDVHLSLLVWIYEYEAFRGVGRHLHLSLIARVLRLEVVLILQGLLNPRSIQALNHLGVLRISHLLLLNCWLVCLVADNFWLAARLLQIFELLFRLTRFKHDRRLVLVLVAKGQLLLDLRPLIDGFVASFVLLGTVWNLLGLLID